MNLVIIIERDGASIYTTLPSPFPQHLRVWARHINEKQQQQRN